MQKGLLIGIVFAVLMVILALQNSHETAVNIYFWKFTEVPVYLVLGIPFLTGIILNASFVIADRYRRRQKRANAAKETLQPSANADQDDATSREQAVDDDDDPLLEGETGFSFFDEKR